MAEYIDRQVAIKDVYAIHTFDTEYDAALIDRLDVRYVLEALPSADVEPVVRCKDCKHRDAETGFCEGRGWPMQLVPDDGFCDKGERRKE